MIERNVHLRGEKVNSLIAALVFLFPFINGAIGVEGSSYITLGAIVVLTIISISNGTYRIGRAGVGIVLFLIIAFLISFVRLDDTRYTLIYFMYFGGFNIIALFAGMQDVDIDKMVNISIYMSFIGTVIYFIRGVDNVSTGIEMGTAYAMLGAFFVSIIGLLCGAKSRCLAVLNVALIFILQIQKAPRGVWLTVIFFVGLCGFYLLTWKKKYTTGLLIKVVLLILACVILVVFVGNLSNILLWLNDFLIKEFDIHIYALWKYSYYLEKGNLLNGRMDIWGSAFEVIKESAVFGKGIGFFETFMKGTLEGAHAHNLILQVFVEGGVIFGIPVLCGGIWCIYFLIKASNRINNKQYLFFVLLFCYGVVMLLYSSVYWMWVPFWFFLGFSLKDKFNKCLSQGE